MKKIVGWALALVSVMSVSSSAMAIKGECPYRVVLKNGPTPPVELGTWEWNLSHPASYAYDEACVFSVKWRNAVPWVSNTANIWLEEIMPFGYFDCFENAIEPLTTGLRLTVDPALASISRGFDKTQAKRSVFALIASEDGYNGICNGMIQYHAATTPYGLHCEPTPTCGPAPVFPLPGPVVPPGP